jgi:hypothetical protein
MTRIRAAALQIFSILIICISFATFAHGIALTSLGTRLKNYVLNLRLHWECFVISAIPYIRVIRGQKNRAFLFGLLFANPFIPQKSPLSVVGKSVILFLPPASSVPSHLCSLDAAAIRDIGGARFSLR